jgi:hypothetical protein
MLSSQWKWWCKQEKKLLVDYAVMKEYAGAFVAVLRDEVRWRSALEISVESNQSTPWRTSSNTHRRLATMLVN